MDGSVRIGSLFGIPVQLHFTFLLVIPLFAWIIGSQILATTSFLSEIFGVFIDTSLISEGIVPWVLGTVISLGLFLGVFIHEVSHSLVAMHYGIQIRSITLLLFGGVSTMEGGLPDPRIELPVALAGPLSSLTIGLASAGVVFAVPATGLQPGIAGLVVYIFGYLSVLNVILSAFNLLPAFPMDGGRVLRAVLARGMPLSRATRIATGVGKAFAILFGIAGVLIPNLILVLIAFLIYFGASQESTAVRYRVLLQDVTTGDIMSRPVITVPPTLPVRDVVQAMYSEKHLGFPVAEHNRLIGMITLADVHRASPIDRDALIVRDVMSSPAIALPADAPVLEALRLMTRHNIGRVPVTDDGDILGIVTRTDIMKVIQLRES